MKKSILTLALLILALPSQANIIGQDDSMPYISNYSEKSDNPITPRNHRSIQWYVDEEEHGTPFEVDGLFYLKTGGNEVKLTSNPENIPYQGDIIIPETVIHDSITYTVTAIGSYAFSECSEITSIVIPNTITTIGAEAFYGCYNLRIITIAESLKFIGDNAFHDCDRLQNVYAPSLDSWLEINFSTYDSNPLYYANHFFVNGEEITDLLLEGITSINNYAFCGYPGFKSLIIPNSVTHIGSYAFAENINLREIIFGDSVATIDEGAFYGCKNLQLVSLPNSLITIGNNAFNACRSITDLTIPDNVTTIEDYAFENCSNLKTITLGKALTILNEGTFAYCYNLTEVRLNEALTSIGNIAFIDCHSLESIIFGDSLEFIGRYAFSNNYSLKSISLPNSLKEIGMDAFSFCRSLYKVKLGNSLNRIYSDAFFEDNALAKMTCRTLTPPTMDNITYQLEHCTTVYVPIQSLDLYKSTTPWKYIKNIVGVNFDAGDVNSDGEINIADINNCIDAIINNDSDLIYDVNGDGEITIADINAIINSITEEE